MALYRLQLGGQHYGDIWSNTLHMKSLTPYPPEPEPPFDNIDGAMEAALDHIESVASAFYSKGIFSSATTLDFIKFNEIDPATGKYVSDGQVYIREVENVKGGSNVYTPPQLTICVTLTTNKSRGRASKGRLFLPTLTGSVTQSGQLATPARDEVATAAATYLNALNNWPGVDLPWDSAVHIWSSVDGSLEKVTGIEVGSVVDTQRSRRNAISEEPRKVLPVS